MKTTIHYYCLSTSTPEGKAAYAAMVHEIEANAPEARGHWMKCLGGNHYLNHEKDTEEVEIETACIFENQWNTTEARVFDWYEEAIFNGYGHENKTTKRGHWLEITPEMATARRDTHKCGYCGAHYGPYHKPIPEGGFCLACLDSPYLKENELHLLRLLPLVGHQKRAELTTEERAALMPQYVSRQTTGNGSRAKAKRDKQRARVLDKFEAEMANALTERDGMLWSWERGYDLENILFYSHTQRFGFGWRSPLSAAIVSKLLDDITEFPFQYTITCDDGRKLEN